jgi:hypothetical protein
MQEEQRLSAAAQAKLHSQPVDLGEVLRAYGHAIALPVQVLLIAFDFPATDAAEQREKTVTRLKVMDVQR